MNNPYKSTPKGLTKPLVSTMAMHDFSSGGAMEEELMPNEICVARIPNLLPTGFTHNVALVYKDDDSNVYSAAMLPHHGVLKNTEENRDVTVQIKSPRGVSEDQRTTGTQEVHEGSKTGGTGQGKPPLQKDRPHENKRQHPPRKNPKGGKKAKRKKGRKR